MHPEFAHLEVHSNFSLLSGTRPVEDLAAAAAARGMKALALTDTDALHAVVPFSRACARFGIRPLYGAVLTGPLGGGGAGKDGPAGRGMGGGRSGAWDRGGGRVVLLARNAGGYSEICRLVTARRLEDDFDLHRALGTLTEDVYVISDDARILERLKGLGTLRAALPVAPGRGPDRRRWSVSSAASRLGVRTVACEGVWFLEPREHMIHCVLAAIRTGTTVGTLPRSETAPPSAFFRSAADVARVFGRDTGPVREASRIADDCRVDLGLGKRRLPRFALPPGEEASAFLRKTALRGLLERLGGGCPRSEREEARRQLDYELSVIGGKGLAGYFLVCWDIVRFARSRGIPSVGRGSAGNSLVSYSLGITHVNPMRHNLFFERFLNPGREQLPDFDIDFGSEDREEVLRYIFRRYGRENVAMIGTYSTLRARSALRETAKALGIPEGEVSPLLRRIPFYASVDRLEDLERVSPAAAGLGIDREPLATLLPLARRIGGFPRHMATHPCGLVIMPEPITSIMPLQRGDKGYEITQWSMHEVEEAGLVKIDIIGQKGLAVIGETARMASENEGKPLHPERIDYAADPGTKRILAEGRTVGCFYIESPVMTQLMRQSRCGDFEVLTALSSIIRPGVSSHGGKNAYLRRSMGLEKPEWIHPAVDGVLCDTFGCLIYQEQVIRIAVAAAGMSYAEADGLRRCMSFKNRDSETMAGFRDSFMRGAARKGIPRAAAGDIFERISAFAGYAFCKAHSASFALESLESAWWKAHYPAEFMAAVISNNGGYYSHEEYLEEAKRLGIGILPPCVNLSGMRHRGKGRAIRIGLMQVKGLSEETARGIIERRPFASLRDLLSKVDCSDAEAVALARCGAMACFGRTRAQLMWELRLLRSLSGGGRPGAAGSGPRQEGRAAPRGCAGAGTRGAASHDLERLLGQIPDLPDYTLEERLSAEREVLDMCISGHPLDMFASKISALSRSTRLSRSSDLAGLAGAEAEIVGWKVTAKGTRTSDSGEEMLFVTFSDRWGRFEAIFFPEVYRRTARELMRARGPFHLRGRVESEFGAESLVVSGARLL